MPLYQIELRCATEDNKDDIASWAELFDVDCVTEGYYYGENGLELDPDDIEELLTEINAG